MIDLTLNPEPEYPPCKGLFYRGYNNIFFSGGRLEQKRGYRFLKRMSCKGCQNCEWLRSETIVEEAANLVNLSEIKEYGLYELTANTIGGGTSFDGYDDYDYELDFNLVENNDG